MMMSALRPGLSLNSAQAMRATMTTWRLATTVASPAPISPMEACQNVRSRARNTPEPTAISRLMGGRWSRFRVPQ